REAVCGCFSPPAAVVRNKGVGGGARGLEGGRPPRLVGPHHARVAGDVGADDGCQASLHYSSNSKTTGITMYSAGQIPYRHLVADGSPFAGAGPCKPRATAGFWRVIRTSWNQSMADRRPITNR